MAYTRGVEPTATLVLALAALLVGLVSIGVALKVAASASFLGARAHETRCDTRSREMIERVQVAERGLDRIADEVAADLSDAKKERQRGQAATARAAKGQNGGADDGPDPTFTNDQLSAWAKQKGFLG